MPTTSLSWEHSRERVSKGLVCYKSRTILRNNRRLKQAPMSSSSRQAFCLFARGLETGIVDDWAIGDWAIDDWAVDDQHEILCVQSVCDTSRSFLQQFKKGSPCPPVALDLYVEVYVSVHKGKELTSRCTLLLETWLIYG